MNKSYFFTILIFFIITSKIFCQRIEKPDNLKLTDFLTGTTSIEVLFQRTLISFPFEEDKWRGEVSDQQYKLSIESIIRIRLRKIDGNADFALLPNIFESDPKIRSIEYNYVENNKIKNKKFKNLDTLLLKNDSINFVNLSSFMKDSVAIIDLFFSMISQKKERIVIFNNTNVSYHDEKITVDIPEIYTYKNLTIADCMSLELKQKTGGTMGYQNVNSPNAPVTGKIMADVIKKDFPNANYRPVYYKLNSNVYTLTKECLDINSSIYSATVNLSLIRVTPIKNN